MKERTILQTTLTETAFKEILRDSPERNILLALEKLALTLNEPVWVLAWPLKV